MSSSRRTILRASGGLLAAALSGLPVRAARAGEERKAAIIARALSYEHRFGTRTNAALQLALVYDDQQPPSRADAQAWAAGFAAIAGVKVNGNPIVVTSKAWHADLIDSLRAQNTDIVLVCAGMQERLAAISTYTTATRVLSVASLRSYVEQWCTLGVFEGDGKLHITINLSAAERERVKFNSRLLKLADVIR